MNPAGGHPPLPLLQLLYARTTDLGTFLTTLFDERERAALVTEADPPAFREHLRRTIVALDANYKAPSRPWRMSETGDTLGMREAVDLAVLAVFAQTSPPDKPSNQLTMGFTSSVWSYRLAVREEPVINPARPSIHAKHPNSTHTIFASAAWRLLLGRVGTRPFVHLLSQTSVFTPLENGCLLQIAGQPVVDLKPPQSAPPRKLKRQVASRTPDEAWSDIADAPARKRRKGRNSQQRKRNAIAQPPSVPESTVPACTADGDEPMDWDSFDYSFAFSPGVDDADIEAELNPQPYCPRKRPRNTTDPIVPVSPADLSIPRNRMFYAKPMVRRARLPSQKRIICGLPEDHVLNSRPTRDASEVKASDLEAPPLRPHPLMLLMHVFPRQFDLNNVFTTASKAFETSGSINYGDAPKRATEIEEKSRSPGGLTIHKKSRMRNPALQNAVEAIRSRWQTENIWRFRAMCCPSKTNPARASSAPPEEISLPIEFVTQPPNADDMTHAQSVTLPATIDLCTQKSLSNVRLENPLPTMIPHGEEEAQAAASSKAQKFVSYTQPISLVERFVRGLVKRVFTLDILGSVHNQNLVLHHVSTFVRQRRYESCTLHSVLQGFKVMDCAWLAPAGFVAGSRVTAGDARKRRELLAEFLWWIFDGFLIPLLKTCFYITESAAYKKEVLYFRQDDWDIISRPVLRQLQATVYKQIPDFEADNVVGGGYRQLGHSQIRLLPKDSGVRPIINLRRKPKVVEAAPFDKNAQKSINQRLAETFSVLVHCKAAQPETFGSSILGADDIYPRLRAFRDQALLADGTLPRLFFAKVDVRSCFDTIEQSTLMDILDDLLAEEKDYQIVEYNMAKLTGGQIKKRFLKEAFPYGATPSFPDQAAEMSNNHKKEILMDKAFSSFISRNEVTSLLREHIKSNTIKIGSSLYRQTRGIPQGSVVSTYLCSLFYADMERKHLAFTQETDSMLVRLVDDFLLVTTSHNKAIRFVQTMHAGHPRYGCYVAPEKTLLSGFECAIPNQATPKLLIGDRFPWCGRLIDTRTLAMMGDYSRGSGNVKSTLTVDVRRQPGVSLRSMILRNIALKSSVAFNDTSLNPLWIVYANIYQNVAHGAMKAVHMAAALGFDAQLHAGYLLRIIDEVGDFAFVTVSNGANTRMARAAGATIAVERAIICWLSKHAFYRVLAAKQTLFAPVIRTLRAEVKQSPNPCAKACPEGWENFVERAWEGVKGVNY